MQRYRKTLLGPLDPLATSNDDGFALYRTLVAPAASLLKPASALLKNEAKVFIIPDGSLNTLNFETLLVPGASPHYWIEDVAIADASSLRMLAAARADNKPDGQPAPDRRRRLSQRGLSGAAKGCRRNRERRQTFSVCPTADLRPRARNSGGLSGEQAGAVLLHSFRGARDRKPHQPARLRDRSVETGLSKAGAADDSFKLYARDIIHHPAARRAGDVFNLLRRWIARLFRRGTRGTLMGVSAHGAHTRHRRSVGSQRPVSTPGLMDDFTPVEERKEPREPSSAPRSFPCFARATRSQGRSTGRRSSFIPDREPSCSQHHSRLYIYRVAGVSGAHA